MTRTPCARSARRAAAEALEAVVGSMANSHLEHPTGAAGTAAPTTSPAPKTTPTSTRGRARMDLCSLMHLGCCSASCAPGLLLKSERKAFSTSYSSARSCPLGGTRECSPARKDERTGVPLASTKFFSLSFRAYETSLETSPATSAVDELYLELAIYLTSFYLE